MSYKTDKDIAGLKFSSGIYGEELAILSKKVDAIMDHLGIELDKFDGYIVKTKENRR